MDNWRVEIETELARLSALPGWISAAQSFNPAEPLEVAAFRSGAALAHLTFLESSAEVPQALWRDRLALAAAEACVGMAGRRESARELRDAVCLTRPGDDSGPAGQILLRWSRAVARPMSAAALVRELGGLELAQVTLYLAATGLPVDRAAKVITSVLAQHPRAETAALILGDAALAKAVGWGHLLPLMALGLKPRDLRCRDDDLRLACHRAVLAGARQAVPLAIDLARRAARLRLVAPRLRAKGAARAVALFLSRDAVTPAMLARTSQGDMSDRATRRLCDRLVALGALRELTGRDSFRLYGL